jgi:site-specific DNA recombinase
MTGRDADIPGKRRLLQILRLNVRLDGATLCMEMRKPFDSLVEGPLVSSGRTDWI